MDALKEEIICITEWGRPLKNALHELEIFKAKDGCMETDVCQVFASVDLEYNCFCLFAHVHYWK